MGRWAFLPFLNNEFSQAMCDVNWRLFADDWARLMPSLPSSGHRSG